MNQHNDHPHIQLPSELSNHMKVLIIFGYSDNECIRWCHIRHLNPQDKDPNRIKKSEARFKTLNYISVQFPVKTNDYKIEK